MLRYCANLKAIKYESTSLNRSVADKSHRVIVASATFPLFSITREGESLCETKEQKDKLDKLLVAPATRRLYSLFSDAVCISSFHFSNPREIIPRTSDKLCKS